MRARKATKARRSRPDMFPLPKRDGSVFTLQYYSVGEFEQRGQSFGANSTDQCPRLSRSSANQRATRHHHRSQGRHRLLQRHPRQRPASQTQRFHQVHYSQLHHLAYPLNLIPSPTFSLPISKTIIFYFFFFVNK